MNSDQPTLADLAPFADLGTAPPTVSVTDEGLVFVLYRLGERTTITFRAGSVLERIERTGGDQEFRHAGFRALLASERYANLRYWAHIQSQVLRGQLDQEPYIDLTAVYSGPSPSPSSTLASTLLDELLKISPDVPPPSVLLLDGPAGVGKTFLIQHLALRRAQAFASSRQPLLLHVKSRGRILSYFTDLIAYSLQTLRLQVTYDQIPLLVRYGLVQLAIDGFDELGDPSGYDTAWGQLGELLKEIGSTGTVVLAGRDTFLSPERLRQALPRLAPFSSRLGVLSVQLIEPSTAVKWLRSRGWSTDDIDRADEWGLFDTGSYVLRPVFLRHLLDQRDVLESGHRPPLIALIERMVAREAESERLPFELREALSPTERRDFISRILEEIARDNADMETDRIHVDTLRFIVQLTAPAGVSPDAVNALANRVHAIAFLGKEDSDDYRAFSHTEFFHYFLARSLVRALTKSEIPKFLRRGILGVDFLRVFSMVVESERDHVSQIIDVAARESAVADIVDRRHRNLGAVLLACATVWHLGTRRKLGPLQLDDVIIPFAAQDMVLEGVEINQLDAREADLTAITWKNCNITTLLADASTRVSPTFPDPRGWIQLANKMGRVDVLAGEEATRWLDAHGRGPGEVSAAPSLRHSHAPLAKLLERLARAMQRQHWIREGSEDPASMVTQEPEWPTLRRLLESEGVLTVKERQASGSKASFIHLKYSKEFLGLKPCTDVADRVLRALNASMKLV